MGGSFRRNKNRLCVLLVILHDAIDTPRITAKKYAKLACFSTHQRRMMREAHAIAPTSWGNSLFMQQYVLVSASRITQLSAIKSCVGSGSSLTKH